MRNQGAVLVIDDDEDILQAAGMFLKQHVEIVHTEKSPESIPSLLNNTTYDVILLDMNFTRDVTSGKEGFHWLNKIMEIDPAAAVVMITAYGDVETAVSCIKQGAVDFVLKPWQNEKLLATVSAALNLNHSRREVTSLRSRQKQLIEDLDSPFHNIISSSMAMQNVLDIVEKVAATDANVLILGENGTGKELVARALHRRSKRVEEVFITVDMGAVSESLFESELFGHVKGAFTDAREDRAGRFEIASKGTLFLDEIGNLPRNLQAKLLAVLQNRKITRVGSNRSVDIDIRLICATNMPIHDLVGRNEFRQDLLFRINTVEIIIPPLRERKEDIPPLTSHFLKMYSRKYGLKQKRINKAAEKKLQTYAWPGNVRELQHTIERAVIMSDQPVLNPQDIILTQSQAPEESLNFDAYNLDQIEKTVIRKTLTKHQGNISHAALELGITRASLYRRMDKYDL